MQLTITMDQNEVSPDLLSLLLNKQTPAIETPESTKAAMTKTVLTEVTNEIRDEVKSDSREEATSVPEDKGYSDIENVCQRLVESGNMDHVRKVLANYGVKTFKAVPEDQYSCLFFDLVKGLPNGAQ